MRSQNSGFYGALGQEKYLSEVRRFVPAYDRMVELIVSRIVMASPKRIIDIGAGMGNIDDAILGQLQKSTITYIEPIGQMVAACRTTMQKYEKRAEVIEARAEELNYSGQYDFAFSNLALHNVSYNDKPKVLAGIKDSLKKGSPFIWGDLVRYKSGLQTLFVLYRHASAWMDGADFSLVVEDFKKETKHDSKLTVDGTLALCREVGFKSPQVVWQTRRSTAAVFYMKK